MWYKERCEVLSILKSVPIALRFHFAIPKSFNRKAWKPTHEAISKAPDRNNDDKRDAYPAHGTWFKDAEILEEKRDLDNGGVADIDGILYVKDLQAVSLALMKACSSNIPEWMTSYLVSQCKGNVFLIRTQRLRQQISVFLCLNKGWLTEQDTYSGSHIQQLLKLVYHIV